MAFDGKRVFITGGTGYVGFTLAKSILSESPSCKVTLYDLNPPVDPLPPGCTFRKGCVADGAELNSALIAGADMVFHVASYGMSGKELRDAYRIKIVNHGGTRNVLNACKVNSVPIMVYVSTVNVMFHGQPIVLGDETAPYPPKYAYKDDYSRTKAEAEKIVLEADRMHLPCPPNDQQKHLRTCAIRSVGIYGPGETRHQPRIIRMVQKGLFMAKFGCSSEVQWIHVNNLVQALKQAAIALGPAKKHIAAGQAYYVADNLICNNFEFWKPLIVGLGYHYPSLEVPLFIVYMLAYTMELLWPVLNRFGVEPPLTPMEVDKCSVTHTFLTDKARRDLGFEPKDYGMEEVVEYMAKHGYAAKDAPRSPPMRSYATWLLALVVVMLAAWIGARLMRTLQ